MKAKLWTKSFILLIISTFISAVAGEAFNLPFSLTVFNETKSSLLSAIMLIAGFVPDILLGVWIAPLVDKWNKKRIVVALDCVFILLFILGGLYFQYFGFHYGFLLGLSLVLGTVSIVYSLAYHAWFPDILTKGMEQQSYSISFIVYPIATVAMAPVSAFLYKAIGMHNLFYIMAVGIGVAILLEMQIPYTPSMPAAQTKEKPKTNYLADLKMGLAYFKQDKGILYISIYVAITSGLSDAVSMLTQLVFQTTPGLTEVMYGTLISAGMLARVIAGAVNSKVTIPRGKRYRYTRMVYYLMEPLTVLILFQGNFLIMLVVYFVLHGMGQVSGTLRNAAFANYIQPQMRARVSSIQSFMISILLLIAYLGSGALGEGLPYRMIALGLAVLNTLAVYFLIDRQKNKVAPIYEHERVAEQ